LAKVIEESERCGIAIKTVEVVEPDLEAVFLRLTGTALRE
jgi:ABC-2 type transport system ATP-binding protein